MSDEINKAAAAMGRKGGSVKSEAKAEAARENGIKGGRPNRFQSAIDEYVTEMEKTWFVYNPEKTPIIAARKMTYKRKTYDVIVYRCNTHIKGQYKFRAQIRERGTTDGGFEREYDDKNSAMREFWAIDDDDIEEFCLGTSPLDLRGGEFTETEKKNKLAKKWHRLPEGEGGPSGQKKP
jgi:hypothetical protein